MEKAGLLPASMDQGGMGPSGEGEFGRNFGDGLPPERGREPPDPGGGERRGRRRLADVFIPRVHLGGARALDFAVTSGMRSDREAAAIADLEEVIRCYEDAERDFRQPGA